jgi:hypothetical protein
MESPISHDFEHVMRAPQARTYMLEIMRYMKSKTGRAG